LTQTVAISSPSGACEHLWGAAASIVILLRVYYSAQIFLLGAEFAKA
jgi:uncharacterized BrkB/YihY/UPF0761 family membrane protein